MIVARVVVRLFSMIWFLKAINHDMQQAASGKNGVCRQAGWLLVSAAGAMLQKFSTTLHPNGGECDLFNFPKN
jgi:hypothetical protein